MILKFPRLSLDIPVVPGEVTTLQIEHRGLFGRVVQSVMSGEGLDAIEPYSLWDEASEKKVPTKKGLLVLDSFPQVPLSDRTFMGRLYASVAAHLDEEGKGNEALRLLFEQMSAQLEQASIEMWGTYRFDIHWDAELFMKAFSFRPSLDDETIIEKCIRFFELCVDIHLNTPVVLVNVKSFFTPNNLQELFSQAFFLKMPVLLLESWPDEMHYEHERKIRIDEDFLVSGC